MCVLYYYVCMHIRKSIRALAFSLPFFLSLSCSCFVYLNHIHWDDDGMRPSWNVETWGYIRIQSHRSFQVVLPESYVLYSRGNALIRAENEGEDENSCPEMVIHPRVRRKIKTVRVSRAEQPVDFSCTPFFSQFPTQSSHVQNRLLKGEAHL